MQNAASVEKVLQDLWNAVLKSSLSAETLRSELISEKGGREGLGADFFAIKTPQNDFSNWPLAIGMVIGLGGGGDSWCFMRTEHQRSGLELGLGGDALSVHTANPIHQK